MTGRDTVVVHVDAVDLGGDRLVGKHAGNRSSTGRVFSFSYEKAWLTRKDKFALDPSLDLYEGEQSAEVLPGIFTDAVPDRWGRTLMERREAILAKREGRRPRTLDEWDFLIGVSDHLRSGALRIANPVAGRSLANRLPDIPAKARLRALA